MVQWRETLSQLYIWKPVNRPFGHCLGLSIFPDGPYSAPTSVNQLMEVFCLEQPPLLICINQGGYFKAPASVNRFGEAVFLTASVNKK